MSIEEVIEQAVARQIAPLIKEIRELRGSGGTLTTQQVEEDERYGWSAYKLSQYKKTHGLNFIPGKPERYRISDLEELKTKLYTGE